MQGYVRGRACGFGEQVHVEVVTHLDPDVQDRSLFVHPRVSSVGAMQWISLRARTGSFGKIFCILSMVVIHC
jgi:hypothetical protein